MPLNKFLFGLAILVLGSNACGLDDQLEKQATWQLPATAEVKARVDQWLATRQLDDGTRTAVQAVWDEQPGSEGDVDALQQVAATIALVEPTAQALVDFCQQEAAGFLLPEFPILQEPAAGGDPLVRNQLRLLYGRWLAQRQYYDEALSLIADLQPGDVVDPAGLLFYQAVCHHRLLNKEPCLAAVGRLLENKGDLPTRYETLAVLMEADMSPLQTDSLDEIARLMDDVERRLALARAGKRVRQEEDDVVAKLDKLIEEIEKSQQQQQSSGSAGQQGGQPMQDSQAAGGSGLGEVEQRRLDPGAEWGDLPAKQRQEALQQIGKDLPAHYREVIEEYFRKLARDGNN
jgi:hypothetical protein